MSISQAIQRLACQALRTCVQAYDNSWFSTTGPLVGGFLFLHRAAVSLRLLLSPSEVLFWGVVDDGAWQLCLTKVCVVCVSWR